MALEWYDNKTIKADELTKSRKKITGTRFGAILGQNRWKSPFEAWCEITKTWEKPFEETMYTLAGKAIEPIQRQYMKDYYGLNVVGPADIYGPSFFEGTHGDFYPREKIFGGMWDALVVDGEGRPTAVIEFKTTSRAEDWYNGEIPEYYALQGALYARLMGVDDVYMVASFLEEADYIKPDTFKCDISNTITVPFKISERYPTFEEDYINRAVAWWQEHAEGESISPVYDETKDAEILKELRKREIDPNESLQSLMLTAEEIKSRLDANQKEIDLDEKYYKKVVDQIKALTIGEFLPGYNRIVLDGEKYTFTNIRTDKQVIDKDALEKDGLLKKYTTTQTVYTLRVVEKNKHGKN